MDRQTHTETQTDRQTDRHKHTNTQTHRHDKRRLNNTFFLPIGANPNR